MATLAPRSEIFFTLQASSTTNSRPRAAASARPSEPPSETGLPVTTPGARVADHHRVGVHHPGHGLRVGVDVRRGNVALRTDHGKNFGGVAARHALQLAVRHALGIADHAALGAAVGNIDGGGLPGHPGGQRFHFVQSEIGMEADAALGRAAGDVVLHAIAGKHFDLAVVELYGHGDFQDAPRRAQDLAQAGIELQELRRHVELDLRNADRDSVPRAAPSAEPSAAGSPYWRWPSAVFLLWFVMPGLRAASLPRACLPLAQIPVAALLGTEMHRLGPLAWCGSKFPVRQMCRNWDRETGAWGRRRRRRGR